MEWVQSRGELYNPFCSEPAFSKVNWDLSVCFQKTSIAAFPILVLVSFGLVELFPLLRQRQAGIVLEKGGAGAFTTKLVRPKSLHNLFRSLISPFCRLLPEH